MAQSIDVDLTEGSRRGPSARIPPHNLEAEESLLGAMMLSRDAITAAIEAHLEPSDFYKPAHGAIYAAAYALHSRGEPVDTVTVAEELRRAAQLDELGGVDLSVRLHPDVVANLHVEVEAAG